MRPSDVGVGVLRGVVGDVGFGVDAGPVPTGDGVPGVLAEGFLAAPELGVGLVAEGVLPDVLPVCCEPAVPPAVDDATGDVGTAELPSVRPPDPAGDESAVVGVGAALDWVGTLVARLSIWVPIAPPPDEDDAPPDDVGVGADCGVGEERPETEGPPLVPDGLDVLGLLEGPLLSPVLGEVPPGVGSSKSDRDGPDRDGAGLEYGESEEAGL